MTRQPYHRRDWTPTEDDFMRKWYPTKGRRFCVERLGRGKGSVFKRAVKLGLRYVVTYVENIRMQRVKTPRFAYLLGYLWADGHVSTSTKQIRLSINHHDGDATKSTIDWTGRWRQRKHSQKKGSDMLTFTVTDRRFYNLLMALGYQEKSKRPFNLVCDYLGAALVPYFVHGFFDGDGSIARGRIHRCDRRSISFAGPVNYDWSHLMSILRAAGIASCQTKVVPKGEGGTSWLRFSARLDVLRFYRRFLFRHPFGLERKRMRFMEMVDDTKVLLRKHPNYVAHNYPLIRQEIKALRTGCRPRSEADDPALLYAKVVNHSPPVPADAA